MDFVTVSEVERVTGKSGGMIRKVLAGGRCPGAKRVSVAPGIDYGLWLIPRERLTDGTFTRPQGRPKLSGGGRV